MPACGGGRCWETPAGGGGECWEPAEGLIKDMRNGRGLQGRGGDVRRCYGWWMGGSTGEVEWVKTEVTDG